MDKAEVFSDDAGPAQSRGHRRWVRVSHWVLVLSFLTLGITGVFILAVHPRLYWGEAGNDLVPAILEFPLSDNYRPESYEQMVSFDTPRGTVVSSNRNYEIFNQNGWGRSLHFLAAWFLAVTGLVYVIAGFVSGHVTRELLPKFHELSPSGIWRDLKDHARFRFDSQGGGPPYGLLQRCAYASVVFIAFPLMVITGLTMSPAVTAAYPVLLDVFGGYQSARTIHFFGFAALVLFFVVHVAMVVATGFRRQLRAMTLGS